jgi:hypothetical protein
LLFLATHTTRRQQGRDGQSVVQKEEHAFRHQRHSIYTHICIHAYIYTHTHVYIYMYICIYVNIYRYIIYLEYSYIIDICIIYI